MTLDPHPIAPIPDETARVARAAFPKGNRYMTMRDVLGVIYLNGQFADLYPQVGHYYGAPPWRLVLVTLMPFSENLTDRQAADAVRGRIDWKYALGLDLSRIWLNLGQRYPLPFVGSPAPKPISTMYQYRRRQTCCSPLPPRDT